MARQLEIVVQGRDQASAAFKSAGASAQQMGSKVQQTDSLLDQAKGFRSGVRDLRSLAIAYAVVPVTIDAFRAAYSTISGTAGEAAAGQRALYDSLSQFPIIGKFVGPAAEAMGSAIAHAFGRESTADVERNLNQQKIAIEGFGDAVTKLKTTLKEQDNATDLLGLSSGQTQIEKAQQAFAKTTEDLKKLKAEALKASALSPQDIQDQITEVDKAILAAQKNTNTTPEQLQQLTQQRANLQSLAANGISPQIQQIVKITEDAKKQEAFAVAEGNAKILDDQQSFEQKIIQIKQQAVDQQAQLSGENITKTLQAENRGYEASQNQLKVALEREIEGIRQNRDKGLAEVDKQINDLQPKLLVGGDIAKQAQAQIDALRDEANQIVQNADTQINQSKDNNKTDQTKDRDEFTRNARLNALQIEATAGNAAAKAELDRLNTDRERLATESGLLAVMKDAAATDEQRKAAGAALAESAKARQLALHAESGDTLRDAGNFLLQSEANAGNALAERQLKRNQIEQEFIEQKRKLIQLIDSQASAEDKANAQKALNTLDSEKAKALKNVGADKSDATPLAQAESGQYLTGIQAYLSQDKSQFDPVIASQDAHAAKTQKIVDFIDNWAQPYIQNQTLGNVQVVN